MGRWTTRLVLSVFQQRAPRPVSLSFNSHDDLPGVHRLLGEFLFQRRLGGRGGRPEAGSGEGGTELLRNPIRPQKAREAVVKLLKVLRCRFGQAPYQAGRDAGAL